MTMGQMIGQRCLAGVFLSCSLLYFFVSGSLTELGATLTRLVGKATLEIHLFLLPNTRDLELNKMLEEKHVVQVKSHWGRLLI